MEEEFLTISREILADEQNRSFRKQGFQPLFAAGKKARVLVVGQAPGQRAQQAQQAWFDQSGERLQQWMGVDDHCLRDASQIAMLPMDFFYLGKGKSGDLPPRKDFAPLWHPRLLALMPEIRLTLLVGRYAQAYYLGKRQKENLTATVRAFQEYQPAFFPIVHPSPLNFRWLNKNPWFEQDLVPKLQQAVRAALK